MITPNKYTEPDKGLEALYTSLYLTPKTINESVQSATTDEGDDGLGIEDSEFDTLMESIIGSSTLEEEFNASTEVDPDSDPQVSPQGDDDLSEFDDPEDGGEEGEGEEETVSIPLSQLRPLYDILSAHFGQEPDGDEEMGGEEDILPADDENQFGNDELPTESVKAKKNSLIAS